MSHETYPAPRPERLPERFAIQIWHDQHAETRGYPVDSDYAETYWLPVIGPTSYLLARRLTTMIGATIEPEILAGMLGLGSATRRGGGHPLARTLVRMQQFHLLVMAPETPEGTRPIAIKTHLPPLAARHLARLPAVLQNRHAEIQPPERKEERLPTHSVT